jgi:hypothetical protein
MKQIPKEQALELVSKFEAAGLNRILVQSIITAPNNELAKKMVEAITAKPVDVSKPINRVDLTTRFNKISQFKFTIPNDYSLNSFRKKFKGVFGQFDSNITDENFKLSQTLQAGETKMVTIYRLNQKTTGRDCLTFAKQRSPQLPNAIALAAIWEQNPEAFSRKLWFVGLDEEKFLYQKNSETMIPILGHMSGKPCFDLLPITESLEPGFCIIVMN